MKVKIKTKDKYFDYVKLKCSAVEFLIVKSALKNYITSNATYDDRIKAQLMLKDIEKGVEKCRNRDIG